LVEKTLQLMSEKILKSCYRPEGRQFRLVISLSCIEFFDEKNFSRKMVKVHKTLQLMEKQKYLQPFLSDTVEALVKYL